MYYIAIVGSDGNASELDAGIELVRVTLGEVDTLAAAVLVTLEQPLKLLRLRLH